MAAKKASEAKSKTSPGPGTKRRRGVAISGNEDIARTGGAPDEE